MEKNMKKAFRTITELETELKDIRKKVQKGKLMNGTFGINECKESIKFHCFIQSKEVEEIYNELIVSGLTDRCFNTNMIIACELLMKDGYKNNERNAD